MALSVTSTAVFKLAKNRLPRVIGRGKNRAVKVENPGTYIWYEVEQTSGDMVGLIGIKPSVTSADSLADAGVSLSS
jgi:hypothetical protein